MCGFHTADCTPITMRQLESLIRLTEARAKLELREEATEGDAIDVVEIMRASMVDTAADPSMGANGSLVGDSVFIQITEFPIPSCREVFWKSFREFPCPAWAVACCSSGPQGGGTP